MDSADTAVSGVLLRLTSPQVLGAVLALLVATVIALLVDRMLRVGRARGATVSPAPRQTTVELRFEPQTAVWAITTTIDIDDVGTWFLTALDQLSDALRESGTHPSGPVGGLYERELFTESRGEASVFIPTDNPIAPPGPVRTRVLAAADVFSRVGDEPEGELDELTKGLDR